MVFSALEFNCLFFFFLLQKRRQAAAAAGESTEAKMEDLGSPKKKKAAISSKSKDCSDSHMYWCGRIPWLKSRPSHNYLLPSSVGQKEKIG